MLYINKLQLFPIVIAFGHPDLAVVFQAILELVRAASVIVTMDKRMHPRTSKRLDVRI